MFLAQFEHTFSDSSPIQYNIKPEKYHISSQSVSYKKEYAFEISWLPAHALFRKNVISFVWPLSEIKIKNEYQK